MDASDGHLIALCKRGHDGAWRQIIARYGRLVYSVPRRQGLTPEQADDVFQATFIALHQQMSSLEQDQALPRWLVVVASRESFRLLRAEGKRSSPETLDEMIASDDRDADLEAIDLVRAESVRRGIASLADRCRRLLSRLYFDDASYEEVGAELNLPAGSIGPTRTRCLQKLRAILGESFFAE